MMSLQKSLKRIARSKLWHKNVHSLFVWYLIQRSTIQLLIKLERQDFQLKLHHQQLMAQW